MIKKADLNINDFIDVVFISDYIADEDSALKIYKHDLNTDEQSILEQRDDLRPHSPEGFSWGYPGVGPAHLALAVLCSFLDDKTSLTLYQGFKYDVITAQDKHAPLYLRGIDIYDWLMAELT